MRRCLVLVGFARSLKPLATHTNLQIPFGLLKKYLPEATTIIGKTNQTVMEHTKKVVQMHMLAKNFAEQLAKKLKENGKLEEYGQTFKYRKIFMAQPGNI